MADEVKKAKVKEDKDLEKLKKEIYEQVKKDVLAETKLSLKQQLLREKKPKPRTKAEKIAAIKKMSAVVIAGIEKLDKKFPRGKYSDGKARYEYDIDKHMRDVRTMIMDIEDDPNIPEE